MYSTTRATKDTSTLGATFRSTEEFKLLGSTKSLLYTGGAWRKRKKAHGDAETDISDTAYFVPDFTQRKTVMLTAYCMYWSAACPRCCPQRDFMDG